eukprot:274332_1
MIQLVILSLTCLQCMELVRSTAIQMQISGGLDCFLPDVPCILEFESGDKFYQYFWLDLNEAVKGPDGRGMIDLERIVDYPEYKIKEGDDWLLWITVTNAADVDLTEFEREFEESGAHDVEYDHDWYKKAKEKEEQHERLVIFSRNCLQRMEHLHRTDSTIQIQITDGELRVQHSLPEIGEGVLEFNSGGEFYNFLVPFNEAVKGPNHDAYGMIYLERMVGHPEYKIMDVMEGDRCLLCVTVANAKDVNLSEFEKQFKEKGGDIKYYEHSSEEG